MTSPHNSNPIAASTPNLMADAGALVNPSMTAPNTAKTATNSPTSARTLPRPHCYTNAAPTIMEGNVFRYDFIEQADCPPVNRKLKPKVANLPPELTHKTSVEDKPPEEFPAKPPVCSMEQLNSKMGATKLQTIGPPSVDRKCKPNAYKVRLVNDSMRSQSLTLSHSLLQLGSSATMSPATRRSSGAPLSMVLPYDSDVHGARVAGGYFYETRTLPRQQNRAHPNSPGSQSVQHQRTASAAAAMTSTSASSSALQSAAAAAPAAAQQSEHKLQYFDLDVTNKPPGLNRQSTSVNNLYTQGGLGGTGARLGSADSARAPVKSSVVYNSVDFVKTEAFKRIREERHRESSESQQQ